MPIVVIGAPLGSVVGSHFHRLTLAAFVYVTDTVQLIGALYVVKPWLYKKDGGKTDTPVDLSVKSIVMIIGGAIFFTVLAKLGMKLMTHVLATQGLTEAEADAIETKAVATEVEVAPTVAVPEKKAEVEVSAEEVEVAMGV